MDSAPDPEAAGLRALLHAVMSIGSHLELSEVLTTIAAAAAELVGARYSALGVLDVDGERLSDFITVGMDSAQRELIGDLPQGRGVLGVLIKDPHAIRLDDLSRHQASYGFPPGHPPMRSFLGVPIVVRGQAYGNLYLTEKHGGGAFTEADEEIVLALAAAAGLANQNARLYAEAQRRQRWLEAAGGITGRLLGGAPASEVLPDIAAAARRLADGDISLLALPVGDGTLRIEAADGARAVAVVGDILPAESMTARVMRGAEPMLVPDAQTDPRVIRGALQEAGFGPTIYVPLGAADRTSGALEALGTLVVAREAGGPAFAADVLALVESFAGQAAIALRLGAGAADREQLAVMGDRDRIARDLHDLVIQRLFATGMALEGALRGMQPPEKADRVRRAVDDLDVTIKEIRTAIFALQVPEDDPSAAETLRGSVLAACTIGESSLGFAPTVTFTGPVDTLVARSIADQLLAVLGEALSNVARHAGATAVSVVVGVESGRVSLLVSDNGIGCRPGARRSGLANLEQRASALGGDFSVTIAAAGGTDLRWRVPLPP